VKRRDDRIVQCVKRLLAWHEQQHTAQTGHEQTSLQRQIDADESHLDQLVYQLYGLTAEDIQMVENMPR
jgi:hypothetical protein